MSQDPASYQNDKRQELKDDAGKFGASAQQGQQPPQAPYGQPQYGQQVPYGQPQYGYPQYAQQQPDPQPENQYGQPSPQYGQPEQPQQPEAQVQPDAQPAPPQYGQSGHPRPDQGQQTQVPYGQQRPYGHPFPQQEQLGQPSQFAQPNNREQSSIIPPNPQYGQPISSGFNPQSQPYQPNISNQIPSQGYQQPNFQCNTPQQNIFFPIQRQLQFMEAVEICLRKMFDFSGRGSRSEYWFLQLALALISVILIIVFAIGASSGSSIVTTLMIVLLSICAIPLFCLSLSATSRRLHDSGKSGWLQLLRLIPCGDIIILVLCVFPSDQFPNIYGDIPNRINDTPELTKIKQMFPGRFFVSSSSAIHQQYNMNTQNPNQ